MVVSGQLGGETDSDDDFYFPSGAAEVAMVTAAMYS